MHHDHLDTGRLTPETLGNAQLVSQLLAGLAQVGLVVEVEKEVEVYVEVPSECEVVEQIVVEDTAFDFSDIWVDSLKQVAALDGVDIFWIIDPIDGTINFLHGIPHFAISIALKSNNEIVSGLIFDPIKDEMFYAEKNNGAFLNNQRVRVSNKNNFDECLFAIGGKIAEEPNFTNRRSGSAALDLAYVAAGRYDGYFQKNLNLWDIAAGIILVQEAGGIVEDLNIDNIKNLNVMASNPNIALKFQEKIAKF